MTRNGPEDAEGPRAALAALQDDAPRLPWWIDDWTQAPLHSAVMATFRRWLKRSPGGESMTPGEAIPNGTGDRLEPRAEQ